jgi:hypothetical protein
MYNERDNENESESENEGGQNFGLKITMSCIPKRIMREERVCAPSRKRVGYEKYFIQSIYVFNENSQYVDSGFVQLNDYDDMCKMIRVLPKDTVCLHAFDQWAFCGSEFLKTGKYEIRDLASGSYIRELSELPYDIPYGDLNKDEQYFYSEILLECLKKYGKANEPQHIRDFNKLVENKDVKVVCCRLFERLDIQESCDNGEISEEEKIQRFDNLTCICDVKSEDDNNVLSDEVKNSYLLRAQEEIAEVFLNKNLSKNIKYKLD